jgi:hypothetical protein
MLIIGTLVVLALWLAFVWRFDPDGFREASRKRVVKSQSMGKTE